jgi:hypothetical protein
VTAIFLAVMLIVTLGPDTTGYTLLSKKIDSVAEVFVTGPALMDVTVFSGTFGHWSCAAKALQSLSIAPAACRSQDVGVVLILRYRPGKKSPIPALSILVRGEQTRLQSLLHHRF